MVKTTTAKKDTGAKAKATAKPKQAAKAQFSKGDALKCEVCGLSIRVDRIGDIAFTRGTTLLCCDKPMKKQKAKTATAKK